MLIPYGEKKKGTAYLKPFGDELWEQKVELNYLGTGLTKTFQGINEKFYPSDKSKEKQMTEYNAMELKELGLREILNSINCEMERRAEEGYFDLVAIVESKSEYAMFVLQDILKDRGFEVEFEALDTEDSYIVTVDW